MPPTDDTPALPPGRARLDGAEALVLCVVAFLLLWTVGTWMGSRLGPAGVALAEVATVLLPTVAWVAWRGVSLRAGLALGRPAVGAARGIAAGALAGLGGFYLVAAIVEGLQERLVPLPPALKVALRELIVPPSGARPLLLDLASLAIAPALCEEALFRGALLEALRPVGAVPAVVGTALLFGFFHGSLYRVAPTAALGLLLGAVAWRARSIVPSILLHAINNSLVVVLVRLGHEDPPPLLSPTGAALALASTGAVAFALRAVDARRSEREPSKA